MAKMKKIRTSELPKFDVVDYLKTEKDIAKKSGVTRESLCRALKVEARPRFETVAKVIHALGMKLSVHA